MNLRFVSDLYVLASKRVSSGTLSTVSTSYSMNECDLHATQPLDDPGLTSVLFDALTVWPFHSPVIRIVPSGSQTNADSYNRNDQAHERQITSPAMGSSTLKKPGRAKKARSPDKNIQSTFALNVVLWQMTIYCERILFCCLRVDRKNTW